LFAFTRLIADGVVVSAFGTPLRSPRRNISGRYWAKADNPLAAMNVRFRGKGDMG
jgi:hypothetical protein